MLGVALVVVGLVFLLKYLGVVPAINWDLIWPIALIVLGLATIFRKNRM
ncbi:MAG: DUF5668 domain-containing protein [bacterium]